MTKREKDEEAIKPVGPSERASVIVGCMYVLLMLMAEVLQSGTAMVMFASVGCLVIALFAGAVIGAVVGRFFD